MLALKTSWNALGVVGWVAVLKKVVVCRVASAAFAPNVRKVKTMNDQIQEFARQALKDGLAQCTEGQQNLFKQMYSFDDRSCPIDTVVDRMPPEKLDWAMRQVQSTLDKAAAKREVDG